jgi:hypothetical protein
MFKLGVPSHDQATRRVRPRAATWGGGAFPVHHQEHVAVKGSYPALAQPPHDASAFSRQHLQPPRKIQWAHHDNLIVGSLPEYSCLSGASQGQLPSRETNSNNFLFSSRRPSTSGRHRTGMRDQHTQTTLNSNSRQMLSGDQQWISVAVDILHEYLFDKEEQDDDEIDPHLQHTSDETEALKVVLSEVVFGSIRNKQRNEEVVRNRADTLRESHAVGVSKNQHSPKQHGQETSENTNPFVPIHHHSDSQVFVSSSQIEIQEHYAFVNNAGGGGVMTTRCETLSPTSVAHVDFFNDEDSSIDTSPGAFRDSMDRIIKHPIPILAGKHSPSNAGRSCTGTQTCNEGTNEVNNRVYSFVPTSSAGGSAIESNGNKSSRKRKVLGSSMVHRLMSGVVNDDHMSPKDGSSADGVFFAKTELLSAFYRRVPKLRKFFPYVLASICAECDACRSSKIEGGEQSKTQARHSCVRQTQKGTSFLPERFGNSYHRQNSTNAPTSATSRNRIGLMLFLCRMHLREAMFLAKRCTVDVTTSSSENNSTSQSASSTSISTSASTLDYETRRSAQVEELKALLEVLVNTIKIDAAAEEIAECVTTLLAVDPMLVARTLLLRLTRTWPIHNPSRALSFLNIFDTILHVCPPSVLLSPNEVRREKIEPLSLAIPDSTFATIDVLGMLMRRLVKGSCDAHALVATRSLQILGAPHVVFTYVAPFDETRVHVQEVLHINARDHWSAVVRADSDELFDLLLDFA